MKFDHVAILLFCVFFHSCEKKSSLNSNNEFNNTKVKINNYQSNDDSRIEEDIIFTSISLKEVMEYFFSSSTMDFSIGISYNFKKIEDMKIALNFKKGTKISKLLDHLCLQIGGAWMFCDKRMFNILIKHPSDNSSTSYSHNLEIYKLGPLEIEKVDDLFKD